MAYNTNNPVGSTDPRDLFDNAGNMDKFENGPNPFYPDRFGVQKLSRSGMIENFNNMIAGQEAAFQQFLTDSGFVSLGNYAPGLSFTAYNQYMARGGFFYRPAPSSLPFTTSGTWAGADEDLFVLFSQDDVLRQDLADFNDPAKGAELIGYRGRTVYDRLSETINVMDFGAVPDGVKDPVTGVITGTDNRAFFQAALDYLASIGGGKLHTPKGNYAFYNTGVWETSRLLIKSNVVLIGDGMEQSVLLYNDGAGPFLPFLVAGAGSAVSYDVTMLDLGVTGDWGAAGDWTQRSHLVALDTSGRVIVDRCLFSHSRYFCLSVGPTNSPKEVRVTNSTFFRSAGDGCSIRSADSVVVTGNYFKDINDDAIAVHSRDTEASPVQNSAIITGNHIVDSQGIRVQGIKKATIAHNVITRPHYAGISVTEFGGVEGYTQNFALDISNNVIDTVFDGSYFAQGQTGGGVRYIALQMPVPTSEVGGFVGGPNGAGGIVQPWNYFYQNDHDNSASIPAVGAWFVNISDNICTRTLTTTANYSNYGFGLRYGRGGPVDIQITNEVLGNYTVDWGQIQVNNSLRFANISNNTLFGGGMSGIFLAGTNNSAYNSWDDVLIANNQISAFRKDGIQVLGEGAVCIKGNSLNADPLHSHSLRAANGKWTFPQGQQSYNRAISVIGGFAEVTGNSIRAVQVPIALLSLQDVAFEGNTFYCNPAVEGESVDNIGIGNTSGLYLRGASNLVIMDDDPSSATYGRVLNLCAARASSIPGAGKYLVGHFVQNTNRTVQGTAGSRYVVIGWSRLTTGSNHVLNADWAEVRSLTGT